LAKADLHVHSKHSNQPAEWYLRQGVRGQAGGPGSPIPWTTRTGWRASCGGWTAKAWEEAAILVAG